MFTIADPDARYPTFYWSIISPRFPIPDVASTREPDGGDRVIRRAVDQPSQLLPSPARGHERFVHLRRMSGSAYRVLLCPGEEADAGLEELLGEFGSACRTALGGQVVEIGATHQASHRVEVKPGI